MLCPVPGVLSKCVLEELYRSETASTVLDRGFYVRTVFGSGRETGVRGSRVYFRKSVLESLRIDTVAKSALELF